MSKSRLEAFSDGVIAILITIMVLELRPPEDGSLASLRPLIPVFFSYVLSFIYLGIYWNNHHHLLQAARQVNGKILWANLHLLFWLSLLPFTTAWNGESGFSSPWPAALYGGVLFMAGLAYYLLSRSLIGLHGQGSLLFAAINRDLKGWISMVVYAAAIPVAFWDARLATGLYAIVAVIWLIPDPRIETKLSGPNPRPQE